MGGAGGVANVFIFRDWRIAAGVMIDGINVRGTGHLDDLNFAFPFF